MSELKTTRKVKFQDRKPRYVCKPFERLEYLRDRPCYLLFLADYSTKEIGGVLRMSVSQVRRRLKRGFNEYGDEISLYKVQKKRYM